MARRRPESGRFVLVHQFENRRRLRQARVAFAAGLKEMAHKVGLAPGVIGLAAEEGFDGKSAAVNFAAFDAEIDVGAAGIAGDDVELGADGFLEQFWIIGVRAGDAGGAAFGRLFGVFHVRDGLVRTVGAHIKNHRCHDRRTYPGEFAQVELDFRPADELIEIRRLDTEPMVKPSGLATL